jgi:hypothetical protein
MKYWAAVGLGIVAAFVVFTYGPRREIDPSSKPRTATVITVGPDGSISHVAVEKAPSADPRLITYVVGAIVAVGPVGWVFSTRRSHRG